VRWGMRRVERVDRGGGGEAGDDEFNLIKFLASSLQRSTILFLLYQ